VTFIWQYRCLFLDVVSTGMGGLDFALGGKQMHWLERQLESGNTGTDRILVATPGYQAPARIADGSDADAVEPWPERHLLGTRLGPNRNGRQW
jgi:hypothetical protein